MINIMTNILSFLNKFEFDKLCEQIHLMTKYFMLCVFFLIYEIYLLITY